MPVKKWYSVLCLQITPRNTRTRPCFSCAALLRASPVFKILLLNCISCKIKQSVASLINCLPIPSVPNVCQPKFACNSTHRCFPFQVSEIRDYLANEKIHTEKELYDISCQFEPGLPRRHSEADKPFSSRPVPQFKSNTVGRLAGKRCMSLSRSTTTLEGAVPDSTC